MVLIRIPTPSRGSVSNGLGLVGLVGLLVAIAALTDWRWALLVGSLLAVGLSYLAHAAAPAAGSATPAAAPVRALKPDRAAA